MEIMEQVEMELFIEEAVEVEQEAQDNHQAQEVMEEVEGHIQFLVVL